jgi:hypothetical protein
MTRILTDRINMAIVPVWAKSNNMRTSPRICFAVVIVMLMAFCAGCASMAERGLLPDVKARPLPAVILGPEIILLEAAKLDDSSFFQCLISKDGRAHLFVIDKEKRIQHVEISGQEVLHREMLGVTDGPVLNPRVEAIEHPPGKLRVVAGDKMFTRSEGGKWQEIKGNWCQRFITVGDDLLCAFIARGEDIGAPKRTDWTVGWFILIPVVLWSNVHADKIVLAQEAKDGWNIRAVLDPETKLSAWSDFLVGSDRHGSLSFLYRMSGGSSVFIVGFGPGGGGAFGGDTSAMELRYARVQFDRLLQRITGADDPGSGPGKSSTPWLSIQGLPLASMPFVEGPYDRAMSLKYIGPLDSLFTMHWMSTDLDGLIRIHNLALDDGIQRIATYDMPWINVKIREGKWAPHFDIVTASDLPDSGSRWIYDRDALIKNDLNGNTHVLLVKSKHGFWRWTKEMCYFFKTGNDWTVPLILGTNLGLQSLRSLAVDETGKVFAAWENRSNGVVGRWILPQK